MSASPIKVVGHWLQNLLDPDVVTWSPRTPPTFR
jgi:hypothetical protein